MEELRAACKDPSEAQAIALRLLVDPGGCSGFQYKFELTTIDTLEAEDQVLKKGSLTVRSMDYGFCIEIRAPRSRNV